MIVIPNSLQKGDKVILISTARKINVEEIQPAINLLKSWELEVILGENLFAEDHQFAGTKAQRIIGLQQALDNDEIKAVFCARGGYGTVQIIDEINFSHFQNNPKWIVGYSDVTVLHNHINQNFGIATLHATMPINFEINTKASLTSLKDCLFGKKINYLFTAHPFNKKGVAQGVLVGGNLSILYSLIGTKSQLDTKGKILFIEDLDEYLYHIDRMMMNLDRVGMLKNLAGLIVGSMLDMNDNTIPFGKTAFEIIKEVVAKYNYPVAFDFPAGHIKNHLSLKMGVEMILDIDKLSLKELSL